MLLYTKKLALPLSALSKKSVEFLQECKKLIDNVARRYCEVNRHKKSAKEVPQSALSMLESPQLEWAHMTTQNVYKTRKTHEELKQ